MLKSKIIKVALAALFTLLLAAPAWAQSREIGPPREQVTREIGGRTITVDKPRVMPPTPANFEQFRSDLLAIMAAQRDTAIAMRLTVAVETLDASMRYVDNMQFSQFEGKTNGFPEMTLFKQAVIEQRQVITSIVHNDPSRLVRFNVPGDPFPGAQYTLSLCPGNAPDGQDPVAAYTSGFITLAAELTKEIALDVCNQIVSALAAGGNTSLACIATDAIYAVAKIIDYFIQWCDEDTGAGEIKGGYLRAEYIKDQLNFSIANDNSNKAMLSTQLTNAENHIVTNDNNNKAALSTQIASFQTQVLRSAIERNMAADPASIGGVALFQLPASRGGYLELARQIVIDTYNQQLALAGAGVVVYNPASDLSLGATFTSQGKYREAYYYYRKAYRSIVKYP